MLLQIDPELAEAIAKNTRRYITVFSEAVAELLPVYKQREVRCCTAVLKCTIQLTSNATSWNFVQYFILSFVQVTAKDVLDVFIEHRLLLQQQHRGDAPPRDPRDVYPSDLTRRL